MSLESKLIKMKNKSYMYKQSVRKILDYKITDEELIISTDANLISIKIDKAEAEIAQFLPAEGAVPTGLVKFGEDPKWTNLKNTAYDLVNKLNAEDGAKFIEIANATNQTIRSVVDIMKIEIEAAKLLGGK